MGRKRRKKHGKANFLFPAQKNTTTENSSTETSASSSFGLFDYSKANTGQREAIEATDGPVLIIAGPGLYHTKKR